MVEPTSPSRRYRLTEPSTVFLDHTIAVTELRVQLTELHHAGRLRVVDVQTEPDSWRHYLGPFGRSVILRPDLAITIQAGEFEDAWFLEADRATETPARILATCRRYQSHRAAGSEQRTRGVYPMVAWITPTEARAVQLRRHITAAGDIDPRLFVVRPIDQFTDLMSTGPPES